MLRKRYLWIVLIGFLLMLTVLVFARWRSEQAQQTLYVAPATIPCESSAGPRQCYLVNEDLQEEWRVQYEEIANFAYAPGFFYELLVMETPGTSPVQFTLAEVVAVEAATIKTVLLAPERMPCDTAESGQCYAYKVDAGGDWQPYPQEIEGFTYESGYYYQLTVAERQSAAQPEPIWTKMQVLRKSMEAPALPTAAVPAETAVPETADPAPVVTDPNALAFKPVAILSLGIQSVVPDTWTFVGTNSQAWSSGPSSFINFTAAPGSSARAALEQMRAAMQTAAGQTDPGQLFDAQVNGRAWSIYTRSDGALTITAAATLEGANVFVVSLFAEPIQHDIILDAVLNNYAVVGSPTP